jgi:hypothetical protein
MAGANVDNLGIAGRRAEFGRIYALDLRRGIVGNE